jgi:uncharacterized protein (UPF0262 family)
MAAVTDDAERIVALELDEGSVVRWSPEIQHERDVAIFDLLESNRFRLRDGAPGPYRVRLSLRESNMVLEVTSEAAAASCELVLAVRPLRRVIKDYFMICDSYFAAIKGASPSRIEAIDMARRGLHDEGAELLKEAFDAQVEIDKQTARRLFTLVCVLHLRG